MGFDVKRIFRRSDKHGKADKNTPSLSPNQTDTDSPSEGDIHTGNGGAHTPIGAGAGAGAATASHTTTSSTLSLRNLRSSANKAPPDQPPTSGGIRTRIGRSKESKGGNESGGYFNGTVVGAPPPGGDGSALLDKLFDELRNPAEDSKNELGVESTMGYLTALGLNPETSDTFVALELVQAPSLGEITRKGFVNGWKNAGHSYGHYWTLADQKAYIATRVKKFGDDPAFFKQIYRYTFAAGKEPDQRSMSLENAIEFWKVLFAAPGRPWVSKVPASASGSTSKKQLDWVPLWIQFLTEKWTRSVNRDMWNQTLEFATKSMADPTLSFWSEDGAWPSVIDDFVAWSRANGHAVLPAQETKLDH